MMPTRIVSFREEEALLELVRSRSLNPSQVAKEALEPEVARLRSRTDRQRFDAPCGSLPELDPFTRERNDCF